MSEQSSDANVATQDPEVTTEQAAPSAPVQEEETPKSYNEELAEAIKPLLNKTPSGSYRVAVEHVGIYLELLRNPEFKTVWDEKVAQNKSGEELEKALLDLLASSRITLADVKKAGDEIVKPVKPKGVWMKGLIATALAAERLGPESTDEEVEEVQADIAEATSDVPVAPPEEARAVADDVEQPEGADVSEEDTDDEDTEDSE